MTEIIDKLEEIKQEIIKLQPKPITLQQNIKLDGGKSAKKLLEYINSKDFPDNELADNIEKVSKEFRKNFRLRVFGFTGYVDQKSIYS